MNNFLKSNFLMVFLATTVLVGLAVLVVYLGMKDFKLYEEIKAKKDKINRMSDKTSKLEQMNSEDIKEKAGRLNYHLPSNKDASVLLEGVSSVLNGTGLVLDKLSFVPGDVATDDVALTFTGDLTGLLNFLKRIEKSSPVLTVKSLEISKMVKKVEVGVPAQFSFDTIVTTYYKGLPAKIGGVTAEVKPVSAEELAFIDSLPPAPKMSEAGGFEFAVGGKEDPFSKF